MLHEKIVRLGTSFQMVKDIFFRISKQNTIFILSQCNAHPAMVSSIGNEASFMRNHPK